MLRRSLSNLCVRFIIHKAFDCNPSECSNKDAWFENLCRWSYIDLSIKKSFDFSYERKRFSIHVEKSKSPKINTKIIVARENHNLWLSYCCNCMYSIFFSSIYCAKTKKLRIGSDHIWMCLEIVFHAGRSRRSRRAELNRAVDFKDNFSSSHEYKIWAAPARRSKWLSSSCNRIANKLKINCLQARERSRQWWSRADFIFSFAIEETGSQITSAVRHSFSANRRVYSWAGSELVIHGYYMNKNFFFGYPIRATLSGNVWRVKSDGHTAKRQSKVILS